MDSTLLSVTFNHREELKLECEREDSSVKVSFACMIHARMCTRVPGMHTQSCLIIMPRKGGKGPHFMV